MQTRSIISAGLAAIALGLAGVAPAAAQEVRTQRLVISQFVTRGQPTQVWFYHAFDENCQLIRGFNVAVDRMPKHGEVALDKADRVIDDTFVNTRDSFENIQRVRRCFGKPMPVIVLRYTGARNYSGFDDLQMVNTSADGRSKRLIEFKIGVQ
jgi:uncharacterized protein (DUF1501 family)